MKWMQSAQRYTFSAVHYRCNTLICLYNISLSTADSHHLLCFLRTLVAAAAAAADIAAADDSADPRPISSASAPPMDHSRLHFPVHYRSACKTLLAVRKVHS